MDSVSMRNLAWAKSGAVVVSWALALSVGAVRADDATYLLKIAPPQQAPSQ